MNKPTWIAELDLRELLGRGFQPCNCEYTDTLFPIHYSRVFRFGWAAVLTNQKDSYRIWTKFPMTLKAARIFMLRKALRTEGVSLETEKDSMSDAGLKGHALLILEGTKLSLFERFVVIPLATIAE